MNIIRPSVHLLQRSVHPPMDDTLLMNIYKQIEEAGRTCYKSEDRITNDSAEIFVEMLFKRGHLAMFEHGTVYLMSNTGMYANYLSNKYSVVNKYPDNPDYYITTNLRVIVENRWNNHLKYLCSNTINHEPRLSFRFVCDRGVTHELVRHRVFSFAQESTRFVNYTKKESGITKPIWMSKQVEDIVSVPSPDAEQLDTDWRYWYIANLQAEISYNRLIDYGWKPEEARSILPTDLKSEIVMTGFLSDWIGGTKLIEHNGIEKEVSWGFLPLRTNPAAHPSIRELAFKVEEILKELSYL